MRVHRSAVHAIVLVAAMGMIACDAPDEVGGPRALPSPTLAIAPPPVGVASGVFIDGTPLGKPGLSAWDSWTTLVGKRSSYVMWYADWSSSFQGFGVSNAYGRGSIPVITWEMKNRSA